jgi:hypothetical protein
VRTAAGAVRELAVRVRHVLGVRDAIIVLGFLAANTNVDIIDSFVTERSWAVRIAWLVLVDTLLILFVLRLIGRARSADPGDNVHPDVMGVRGDRQLAGRRAAVVVIGLDSDKPESALSRLLARADRLEFLAVLGTPETRSAKIAAQIPRLLAMHGREIPATHIRMWDENHALSVADFAESATEALGWLARHDVGPEEIVADISAGRRPAGFGVVQAADTVRVESQYLACRWDHETNRPLPDQLSFRLVTAYWDPDVSEAMFDG